MATIYLFQNCRIPRHLTHSKNARSNSDEWPMVFGWEGIPLSNSFRAGPNSSTTLALTLGRFRVPICRSGRFLTSRVPKGNASSVLNLRLVVKNSMCSHASTALSRNFKFTSVRLGALDTNADLHGLCPIAQHCKLSGGRLQMQEPNPLQEYGGDHAQKPQ
jgi:hypothetical protein